MRLHKAKEIVQKEGVQALKDNNGRGLIAIATGGGKSKIAIDYIKNIFKPSAKGILIVPTEKLRDREWINEFEKWKGKRYLKNLRKECYASISKIKNEEYDYVILDEVQFITPNNKQFFDNNKVKSIIALSATPPEENDKKEILKNIGIKIIYELSLDDAVSRGIISPYKVYCIGLNLDNKTKYIKAGNKNKPFYTTEVQQYRYLNSLVEKAKNEENYQKHKNAIIWRMRFIYGLKAKYSYVKNSIKLIERNDRIIIFAGEIKNADFVNDHRYHSKTNNKDFDDFANKKINILSVVNSLNVGVNLPDIDKAIICQVQSKERHLIQRIGRVVRWRENTTARIYILYYKNTVDENWTMNAIRNIDKKNIVFI